LYEISFSKLAYPFFVLLCFVFIFFFCNINLISVSIWRCRVRCIPWWRGTNNLIFQFYFIFFLSCIVLEMIL